MLWQKEISGDLYINLLQNMDYRKQLGALKRKKNNEDSLRARTLGNEKFKTCDFGGAIAKYNQSICLAENDSECLSLAYGNRSACFEKLRKYKSCLRDIQLAIDSNYPERLMQKLNDRKIKCMLHVQSEMSIPTQPTLSFDADENLPCMANVLHIDVNDQYGRLVTATQDIQIGDTVLIEEEYVRFVAGEDIKCTNCGKENENFIPCEKCGSAMFCSELCLNNKFHPVECDMLVYIDFCCEENYFPLYVLRSIIIGLSAFPSVNEMIKLTENWRSTDPYEIPLSTASPISKYRTFFKLSLIVPDSEFLNACKMAYFVYHSIIAAPSFTPKFQTKADQRFLTHLILHHSFILRTNNFGSSSEVPITIFGESLDSNDNEQSIFLVCSYFNHSCCPNITKLSKNNLAICKAILPIRKGEQLFITYVDEDDEELKTYNGRQNYLQKNYGFKCKCQLCENGILKNTFNLQDDSFFINIVEDVKRLNLNFDMSIVRDIKENCKQFLVKYPNMIPSGESNFVLSNFVAMLQLELNNSK